ncbi:MAG: FAD:protein FMN transferase, partial [Desulfoprunum sp.]|nr:FAD:protein FMN transferase [Desulfoprunum sp.]
PWNIGIQNPRPKGDNDALLATVNLGTQGGSTSGDYQRYFMQDGIRYHHLLNPRTGYPESLCRSVTVIAPEATLTDAFATGIFIMGPQKGIAALEKLGLDGIIVDKDGAILVTKGIKEQVHLLKTD